jgi:flagellar protein FlgJ
MADKMTPKDFVAWLYPAVVSTSDISPVFVIAQAALESGWGASRIGAYNLFGVTRGQSWTGDTLLCLTTEYFSTPDVRFRAPEEVLWVETLDEQRYRYRVRRLFRNYRSLEAALADHYRILSGAGYRDAYPYRKSPEEYVRRLVDNIGARYATAPDYVASMDRMFQTVRKYM